MSTKQARPDDIDSADTRTRIVEAARVCFDRHGFAKTTMDDIAREAGISRPTIYNYFPGKKEIIDHIGFEELARADAVVRARIGWHETFMTLATEAIVAAVLASQTNQYIRRFVEALDSEAARKAPTNAYQTEARARWRAILGRARAANELAPDLDMEDMVDWISRNIVSLLKSADQAGADETRLRYIAQRFILTPLAADPRSFPPDDAR